MSDLEDARLLDDHRRDERFGTFEGPAGATPIPSLASSADPADHVGEWESVRDIQRAAQEQEPGLSVSQSQPDFQSLMYPELTVSALATPGGFRRHHVAEKREETFRDYVDLLERLADEPELEVPMAQRASTGKAYIVFLKSFVGTAVLFLPRGFMKAGLLAGVLTLAACGVIATVAMQLLFEVKAAATHKQITSYGHIMRHALGSGGEAVVDVCILFSQLGFCCVYVLFIGQNLCAFAANAYGEEWDVVHVMAASLLALVPLSLVRRVGSLAVPNLVADAIIVVSLSYMLGFDFDAVQARGGGPPPEWEPYIGDPVSYLTFLGTSVYTFEGVAMTVPIQVAMRDRRDFPTLLLRCMAGITTLLVVFAACCYYTFGSETDSIVTLNLPPGPASNAITLCYVLVAVLSYPMMLFPASKMLDSRMGLKAARSGHKGLKNSVRMACVLFTFLVSWATADKLDGLVAVIGGVCCVPLAIIFPPLAHLRAMENLTPAQKALDVGFIVFGVLAGAVATATALLQMSSPS